MKKIICIALSLVMLIGALTLVGCTKEEEKLKMGFGVYAVISKASSAEEDMNGQGTVDITAAAVTVDKDGKIVDCVLDVAQNKVAYTSEGKAIVSDTFKTKYELGDAYNMRPASPIGKEWDEQTDAFLALVKGKTLAQVKAMVAEGNKGTDDVIAAGCTMNINEFVFAIEKAFNNAKDSNVTASDSLKLGTYTSQTNNDASEDVIGKIQTDTTFFAAAVDADGKIVAALGDCIQVKFTFDDKGISSTDTAAALKTKYELDDAYNMRPASPIGKEWDEQANVFLEKCVGKTIGEVEAFMASDLYPTADIKDAGCTMKVDGFVKAAAKLK